MHELTTVDGATVRGVLSTVAGFAGIDAVARAYPADTAVARTAFKTSGRAAAEIVEWLGKRYG